MPDSPESTAYTGYRDALALSRDLAALWNGGEGILADIAAIGGRRDGNAYAALRSLGHEDVSRVFADAELRARLARASIDLDAYYHRSTWFDETAVGNPRLAQLRRNPIAYFCAEFGLVDWLQIYSGGLGILAGDVLKGASDLGLPIAGVGLLYHHGYFHQSLDGSGHQQEWYPPLDPNELPLTPCRDAAGADITVSVPILDHTVYARIWQLKVGRSTLLLLDTDIDANDHWEDRLITGHLYGGDTDTRIRQEILLGLGGARALAALDIQPSVYSMNEGHAAFLTLALLHDTWRGDSLEERLAQVRRHVLYTNHTVVPAGNDIFPRDLAATYLTPVAHELGLDLKTVLDLGANPQDGRFSMAHLAFRTSGRANAVSSLHAEIIPRHWPGYTVTPVTNGVHLPTWLGASMAALADDYASDWRQGTTSAWQPVGGAPDAVLWKAHEAQRRSLVDWVNTRAGSRLDPGVLTLVWARRVAAYKRLNLIVADPGRLAWILNHPERPVQIVVSGKAHPRDEGGKRILQDFLEQVSLVPELRDRVVFLPDYEIGVARRLVAGADVWVNTPRKPMEASGTSGMKAGANGALALTVPDGWAAEVDWQGRGWIIEGDGLSTHEAARDAAEAESFYRLLEGEIVPCFYDRDERGLPNAWITAMKSSIITVAGHYNVQRMLHEYVEKLYLPLMPTPGFDSLAAE